MQTKGGKVARGPTAEEFQHFISECKTHWKLHCQEAGIEPIEPIFSWDNASIHGDVEGGGWAEHGITSAEHTLLPPYSPDMHSVIELCHALVMVHMRRYIGKTIPTAKDSLEQYINQLRTTFHAHITPSWAQRTTHRLFWDVLPAILEHEGRYAPKSKR